MGLVALSGPVQPAVAVPVASESASQHAGVDKGVSEKSESYCSGCGYSTKVTKLSSKRVKNRHVRNLTGSWAKSKQYTWTETVTVTASLTANVGLSAKGVASSIGATYSTSKGYSVATHIPANSKRCSKLALRTDFNKCHVRVDRKMQGITTSSKKGYLYSPLRGSQTLYVNYKK